MHLVILERNVSIFKEVFMTISNNKKFYTTLEVSEYLNVSKAKLERDRCLFGHDSNYLPWVKINGSVRYPIEEVEKWLEERGKGA